MIETKEDSAALARAQGRDKLITMACYFAIGFLLDLSRWQSWVVLLITLILGAFAENKGRVYRG
jgi:fatty acid desaturase